MQLVGSDKLYSGSKDESVRVWDCQTGQVSEIVLFVFLYFTVVLKSSLSYDDMLCGFVSFAVCCCS